MHVYCTSHPCDAYCCPGHSQRRCPVQRERVHAGGQGGHRGSNSLSLCHRCGSAGGRPPSSPLSGTGSLVIRSTPEGATVYLNGESRGVTPLTLINIPPGTHRILLTHPGYSDYQEVVQVSAGAQSMVTAQMETGQKSPGFEAGLALVALVGILILWRSSRQS